MDIRDVSLLTPEQVDRGMVEDEKRKTRARQLADEELDAEDMPTVTIHKGDDWLSWPDPQCIIEGCYTQSSMAFNVAESGVGKTFLQLGQWLSLGCNAPTWMGKRISAPKNPVVIYVLAEGAGFFKYRVLAWLQTFAPKLNLPGLTLPPNVWFTTFNLRLAKPTATKAFVNAIAQDKPFAVFIDTWNRHGAPEGNDDIDVPIQNVDLIREKTGAFVCSAAHTPKDGRMTLRGHSAPDAAADTVAYLQKVDGLIKMQFEQRDLEPSTLMLKLTTVTLDGLADEFGNPRKSLVMELADAKQVQQTAVQSQKKQQTADHRLAQIVEYVQKHPGCSFSDIENFIKMSKQRLSQSLAGFVANGVLERIELPSKGAVKPVEYYCKVAAQP